MNYQALYAALSQSELRNVAARARLSIADVRQEALLWCWQVARRRCDYDAKQGTVRRYVMAKLWGLAARESELPVALWREARAEVGDMPYQMRTAETRQATSSVLDELIEREEREEVYQRVEMQCDLRRRYAGLSTTSVLMEQGISSVRVALLIGVTPQAVRQRAARERARIERRRGLTGRW